jgi:cytochrome c-type biogenesis protein CcmE
MKRLGSRKVKVIIAAAVVVVAAAVLLGLGLGRGVVYYYSVSELNALSSARNVRVSGELVAGSLVREGNTHITFQIHDRDKPSDSLDVVYDGALPDAFKDKADAEVVVEGDRLTDGTFQARILIAKCPSKYEAAP